MTLEGTNSYVLRAPDADGHAGAIVVDPGPLDELHLAAVVAAADGHVGLVLLTHGHPDHSDGALLLQEMTGAPMAAADPRFCVGAEPLRAGTQFDGVAGLDVRVLATPGHTADSVSFVVPGDEPGLLTGDTILGRGTTVVAHPDGRLADYLGSLAAIRDLPGPLTLLPGPRPRGRRRGGAGRRLPGAPGRAAGPGTRRAGGRRHHPPAGRTPGLRRRRRVAVAGRRALGPGPARLPGRDRTGPPDGRLQDQVPRSLRGQPRSNSPRSRTC